MINNQHIKCSTRNEREKREKHNKQNLIDSIRFSIRISSKSVSSVSLKKNIVSLWLLLCTNIIDKRIHCISRDRCKTSISDFMYKNLKEWEKDTAKGFSEFITDKMIDNILEEDDFIQFKKIKDVL